MSGDSRQNGSRVARPARLRARPPQPDELAEDRANALRLTPVSRETEARLDRFVALLLDWQQRLNLIAPSTEAAVWTRHVADSLQLLALAPRARVWADFGTGGGFPGLVLGCALADVSEARIHLVESSTRKAAFLREAVRLTGAAAIVHVVRAADFAARPPEPIEAVTARAMAPLPVLLEATYPLLKKGATGLFPKGQGVEAELTEAAKCWKIQATFAASRTDAQARIVIVSDVEPLAKPDAAPNRKRG